MVLWSVRALVGAFRKGQILSKGLAQMEKARSEGVFTWIGALAFKEIFR